MCRSGGLTSGLFRLDDVTSGHFSLKSLEGLIDELDDAFDALAAPQPTSSSRQLFGYLETNSKGCKNYLNSLLISINDPKIFCLMLALKVHSNKNN